MNIHLAGNELSMRFGRQILFEDLSFNLAGGSCVGISGNNGAGKSTLLKLIAGLFPPTKGDIALTLNQQNIVEEARKFKMGWVAPYLKLYDGLSLAENIRFLATVRGINLSEEALKNLLDQGGMWEKRHQRLEGFSSGMKQRALLFSALVHNPPVLLWDEPTSNLDEAGKSFVYQIRAESVAAGKLVIWATNEGQELATCDTVIHI